MNPLRKAARAATFALPLTLAACGAQAGIVADTTQQEDALRSTKASGNTAVAKTNTLTCGDPEVAGPLKYGRNAVCTKRHTLPVLVRGNLAGPVDILITGPQGYKVTGKVAQASNTCNFHFNWLLGGPKAGDYFVTMHPVTGRDFVFKIPVTSKCRDRGDTTCVPEIKQAAADRRGGKEGRHLRCGRHEKDAETTEPACPGAPTEPGDNDGPGIEIPENPEAPTTPDPVPTTTPTPEPSTPPGGGEGGSTTGGNGGGTGADSGSTTGSEDPTPPPAGGGNQ